MSKFEYKKPVAEAVVLDETAVRIATKIVKNFEGCNLRAYPDSSSDLYKALSLHNMLQKYMSGKLLWKDLPDHFKALSGAPFTCGWGETKGVNKDTLWTQEEADKRLDVRVREFMQGVIKIAPVIANKSSEKIAAITSLVYNIGLENFRTSTRVTGNILKGDDKAVAAGILLWNKDGVPLKIVEGLDKRRKIESALWSSV
jgi:GH24 family phage-related lysozyme (muramidase)